MLGTVVPLLEPYLPILVLILIICRQWKVAILATVAMLLVSTTHAVLSRDTLTFPFTLAKSSAYAVWMALIHGNLSIVKNLYSQEFWVLISFTASLSAAIFSAPSSLRWRDKEKILKEIDVESKFIAGTPNTGRPSDRLKKYIDSKAPKTNHRDDFTINLYAKEILLRAENLVRSELRKKQPNSQRRILRHRARLLAGNPQIHQDPDRVMYISTEVIAGEVQRQEWNTFRQERVRKSALRILYGVIVGSASVVALIFIASIYQIPLSESSMANVLRQPWIPPEIITTKKEGRHVVYVLSTSDGWFTVLEEHGRNIEYFPSNDVMSREVCVENRSINQDGPSLIDPGHVTGTYDKPCP